jgi:DNA replication ATP-dependent helicase Dna2
VIVSYGVSDPEFAAQEAEFIYGLNRLNVAVTRARSKCVVFLPRTLLDASPHVLDQPQAVRGLAYMRDLVARRPRGAADDVPTGAGSKPSSTGRTAASRPPAPRPQPTSKTTPANAN